MSMVIAYITNEYAVISGDVRRVHMEENDVYFDDTHKVMVVNERVMVGLTGDLGDSIKLRAHLEGKKSARATVNAIARECRQWLRKHTKQDTQQTVLITGIGDAGKPIIAQVSHRNKYKVEYTTVKPGGMQWQLAFANVNPEPIIVEELAKLEVVDAEACAALAKAVNERVSAVDSFVSSECDVAVLSM